jgi:sugar O-acyltransferase (sialic acid O-acetyltransferase NeuD family)
MATDLAVFGAGGHAREVIELVRELNAASAEGAVWRLVGIVSDRAKWKLSADFGLPRLGGIDWLKAHPSCTIVIAVGNPQARQEIAGRIRAACENPYATLVHPRAWLAQRVTLGEGSQVLAGALLNVDVRIGVHAILNIGSRVSHDAVVGDFATLGPGATLCGGARVGNGCELGAGAVVLPRVEIEAGARLGAGSVAVAPVAAGLTVVGVPARPL